MKQYTEYKVHKTENPKKIQNHEKSKKSIKDKNEKDTNKVEVNDQSMNILTVNAADLRMKVKSLKSIIHKQNITIFSVQETHYNKKGKFLLENFVIFEAIRAKQGGGSLVGIKGELQPVLISEYKDTFELIVTEVKLENKRIRIMTGYGPQENAENEDKISFFSKLEEEIARSTNEGKGVILMGDLNSKLGKQFIKHDPHNQSQNGKMLADVIERNALIVVNGLEEICLGTITRKRVTREAEEKSVIDFVIVSNDLKQNVIKMEIDEDRKHSICKITKTKAGVKVTESDHNTIITKMKMKWKRAKQERREIFNLKNKKCQESFKIETDKTNELSKIVESNKNLDIVMKKLFKRIDGFINQCFKKIRVTERIDEKLENLFDERNKLRNKKDIVSKKKLKEVEKELADKYSDEMYDKIKKELKEVTEEVGWNPSHLWKMKKKISPRPMDPPTAMTNKEGKLLTDKEEILDEAVTHFENLFKEQEIHPEYNEIKQAKEKLWQLRKEKCERNKTEPWKMENLNKVLKNLKNNKSRDPNEYANEIFKENVAGEDLKQAILKLMNRIKEEQKIPKLMQLCNITTLYKNKGPRDSFNSYRGIFRVTVMRNILERLVYNDMYETIERNLTDSNVGNRKRRNIRDNLFVINAILMSANSKHVKPVDVVVTDIQKCFDTMWAQESLNDLYDLGFKNDKLSLLACEDETAEVVIKTSVGKTKRISIHNIIMQGTVWAGLRCTATMDVLGKQVYENPELCYLYKGKVQVPPLEMVDDVITVSECGSTAVTMNSVVNTFIRSKKLALNVAKCGKIHVGKKSSQCPDLKAHDQIMKNSNQEKYLGDIISKDGKPHATVVERKIKGYGIVANIIALITDIPLGNRRVKIGLDLRQAWFLNGILYNSEVWPQITQQDLKMLAHIDQYLMRSILGAHSKTPIEILYLETGSLPIESVIKMRRIIYLQTILKRPKSELTRRVYEEMKNNPMKTDWSEMIKEDFKSIGVYLDENHIENQSEAEYKREIKTKVREAAFVKLLKMQQEHNKVKGIKYTDLKSPQEYLINPKFNNDQVSLLFNLRCRTVKSFKQNFRIMNNNKTTCELCKTHDDTQEHAISCSVIRELVKVESETNYEDIFASFDKQMEITSLYSDILEIRERLIGEEQVAYRGTPPDHLASP